METAYDWITLAIFSGLVVLFLDRSTKRNTDDPLWAYLVAGAMCGIANYLGNNKYEIFAVLVIVLDLGFIAWYLNPLNIWRR